MGMEFFLSTIPCTRCSSFTRSFLRTMISMFLLSVVSLHGTLIDWDEETAWKCGFTRRVLEEKAFACARNNRDGSGEPLSRVDGSGGTSRPEAMHVRAVWNA